MCRVRRIRASVCDYSPYQCSPSRVPRETSCNDFLHRMPGLGVEIGDPDSWQRSEMPCPERETGCEGSLGEIDLAIGPLSAAPEAVDLTPLFEERFVMISRRGHPGLRKRLSPPRFAALHHLLVSPRGDPSGVVDQALRELGLARRIVVTVPHFLAAPIIVASTDLVAVVPERVARRMRSAADIEVRDVPVDIPGWTVGLARPKNNVADSFMTWLVQLIHDVSAELGGGSSRPRRPGAATQSTLDNR